MVCAVSVPAGAAAQDDTHTDAWFPNFGLKNLSDTTISLPFNTTLDFYGQLSPVAMLVDDGSASYASIADNGHSVTRLGAIIKRTPVGRVFQFRFETSLGIRKTSNITQNAKGPFFDWNSADIRYADFSWKFPNGRVFSIGQGAMATDGVTSLDLSGTSIATSVSIPDISGGYQFRTDAGALSGIEVADVFQTFDGIRRARLRFDTKSRGGFWFSVSAGAEVLDKDNSQQNIDTAVFFERKAERFHIQAAAGQSITKEDGEETRADTVGSITLLDKKTGLNATLAAGARLGEGGYVYAKFGYITRLLSQGKTAFSIDYMDSDSIVTDGAKGKAWGLAAVQIFDALDTEVYIAFRNIRLSDNTVISFRDIRSVFFGARWTF